MSANTYRGKYPNRINVVTSQIINDVRHAVCITNSGQKYLFTPRELNLDMPCVGVEISYYLQKKENNSKAIEKESYSHPNQGFLF